MIEALVLGYLGGWILVTLGVYGASRRLSDPRSPAPHPLGVSILAGALWPLLFIGLVEMSSVVVCTKARAKPETIGIFA
ncbi:MAG TPA: hypothetical protein VHI10_03070 [Mycobacterium sp.]|nr:hypothetical protein [Mycobacterium sp.]